MFERVDNLSFFLKVVALCAIMHSVDILSSVGIEHFIGGCESNINLVNPVTCGILVNRAIIGKFLTELVYSGGLALGLKWATKSWFFASLPFALSALETFFGPDVNNLNIFLVHILRHIGS